VARLTDAEQERHLSIDHGSSGRPDLFQGALHPTLIQGVQAEAGESGRTRQAARSARELVASKYERQLTNSPRTLAPFSPGYVLLLVTWCWRDEGSPKTSARPRKMKQEIGVRKRSLIRPGNGSADLTTIVDSLGHPDHTCNLFFAHHALTDIGMVTMASKSALVVMALAISVTAVAQPTIPGTFVPVESLSLCPRLPPRASGPANAKDM